MAPATSDNYVFVICFIKICPLFVAIKKNQSKVFYVEYLYEKKIIMFETYNKKKTIIVN